VANNNVQENFLDLCKLNFILIPNTLALMEGKILAIFLGEIGMTAGNSS
jgi:hypothetical protein